MQSTTFYREPSADWRLRLDRNEPTAHADVIGSYPDLMPLRTTLAARLGIATDRIAFTAGADSGLDIVCRSIPANGTIVMLRPDFVRYPQHATNARLNIKYVDIRPGDQFPTGRVLDALDGAQALLVSTISNPVGVTTPVDFLDLVADRHPSLVVILDEVYDEFAAVHFARRASLERNVISIGSLSKSVGPGLRVGYIVAEPETLARLRPFVSPVAISGLSVQAAVRALGNPMAIAENVRRQIAARTWLAASLRLRGFSDVYDAANWVLVRIGSGAKRLAYELAARGIAVNTTPHAELQEWLRISTPNHDAVELFVSELDDILDGAIVNVEDMLELRDAYLTPGAWLHAPFVLRVGADVMEIDHVAITMADEHAHADFVAGLVASGATLVEGLGRWPRDFCPDLTDFPPDLEMFFATAEVTPAGLLVVAAPVRPGDQLSRFRAIRGPYGVHHVGIRVTDIDAAAAGMRARGFAPMSPKPVESDTLRQLFLRNASGQIVELISRVSGSQATFSCDNLRALRLTEKL